MKTLILIVISIVGLGACSDFTDSNHFEIDSQVKPFVDNFYKIASQNGINLPKRNLIIFFGDIEGKEHQIAITHHNSIPEIHLDYQLQERIVSDPLFFETVLYHELGHAIFHREHCYDCYSLMNPNTYVQDYRLDSVKRMILIKELLH